MKKSENASWVDLLGLMVGGMVLGIFFTFMCLSGSVADFHEEKEARRDHKARIETLPERVEYLHYRLDSLVSAVYPEPGKEVRLDIFSEVVLKPGDSRPAWEIADDNFVKKPVKK